MSHQKIVLSPPPSLGGVKLSDEECALLSAPYEQSDRRRRQRVLLKVMGIEYWHLKQGSSGSQETPAVAGPSGYVYELCCANQSVGLLLAAAQQEDPKIEQLLLRMIEALCCASAKGQWCFQPSQETLCFSRAVFPGQQRDWRFIVTLGEGWDTRSSAAVIVKGEAPDQLIEYPSLKRRLWQSLQVVFPLLVEYEKARG